MGLISIDFFRTFATGSANLGWIDIVNDETFTFDGRTYPIYSLRVKSYDVEKVKEQGSYFRKCHLELLYNRDLWVPTKKLNQGTYKRVAGPSMGDPVKIVQFTDDTGNTVSEPVLLKADGSDRLGSLEAPNYINFTCYLTSSFDDIFAI